MCNNYELKLKLALKFFRYLNVVLPACSGQNHLYSSLRPLWGPLSSFTTKVTIEGSFFITHPHKGPQGPNSIHLDGDQPWSPWLSIIIIIIIIIILNLYW